MSKTTIGYLLMAPAVAAFAFGIGLYIYGLFTFNPIGTIIVIVSAMFAAGIYLVCEGIE